MFKLFIVIVIIIMVMMMRTIVIIIIMKRATKGEIISLLNICRAKATDRII